MDVLLILTRGTDVLLALRENTGYADGQWNVPSGKLEDGEHVVAAVLRETTEEIGLRLRPDEVRLAVTVHNRGPAGQGRVGLFFHTRHDPDRHGEPVNAEPHKCGAIGWYPLTALPANTVPYTAVGIEAYRTGTPLALAGWPPDQ